MPNQKQTTPRDGNANDAEVTPPKTDELLSPPVTLEDPAFKLIAIALARILAATPHSCDVERQISSYNRLKTIDRSRLMPETMNDYLHLTMNMPVLAEWNPWDAVNLWISEKDRRQIKCAPQMDSDCFVGVFREATEKDRVSSTVQRKVKF